MKPLLTILLILMTSGCVYPIYKTLQPQSEVYVEDEGKNPVQGAEVYLVSNAYPYGFEKSRHMVRTNSGGFAYFKKIKEWRTEILAMHGSEIYFWNWCVKKEGYITQYTNYRDGNDFNRDGKFVLKVGVSEECPEEFR